MPSQSILLLENHRQTLTVIRALSSAGWRVVLGVDRPGLFTESSQGVSEVWNHPPFRDEERFISSLQTFLKSRQDIRAVFPIGEIAQVLLCQHPEVLTSNVKVIMPDASVVTTCLDKPRLFDLVRELGIPLPKTLEALDLTQLETAVGKTGFPCVVKPKMSIVSGLKKKAIPLASWEEFRKSFPKWPVGSDNLLIQKYIHGVRHNCVFWAVHGRVHQYLEIRVRRVDTWDGTGNGVDFESVKGSEVRKTYCETLLRKLNYTGVGVVQFLIDEKTGDSTFLELNPRLGAGFAVSYYSGFNLPLLALRTVLESPEKVAEDPAVSGMEIRLGTRACWLQGDVEGFVHAVKLRELGVFQGCRWIVAAIQSFLCADCHLIFSWRDPLPALRIFMGWMRSFMRR